MLVYEIWLIIVMEQVDVLLAGCDSPSQRAAPAADIYVYSVVFPKNKLTILQCST